MQGRQVTTDIQLGLKANWPQFSLLLLVNAFVGAMIGMERSILPAIAAEEFHLAAKAAILSFIVVFGIVIGEAPVLAGDGGSSAGSCRKARGRRRIDGPANVWLPSRSSPGRRS